MTSLSSLAHAQLQTQKLAPIALLLLQSLINFASRTVPQCPGQLFSKLQVQQKWSLIDTMEPGSGGARPVVWGRSGLRAQFFAWSPRANSWQTGVKERNLGIATEREITPGFAQCEKSLLQLDWRSGQPVRRLMPVWRPFRQCYPTAR